MNENKKRVSTTTKVTIIFLVLFFPVGLLIMWRKTRWPRSVKWAVTAVFALILFGDVFALSHSSQLTANEVTTRKPTLTATPTPTYSPTPTLSDTPTPKPTKYILPTAVPTALP